MNTWFFFLIELVKLGTKTAVIDPELLIIILTEVENMNLVDKASSFIIDCST
jgi:hypothetical protein